MLPVVLIFEQFLVEDANKGVLVSGNILADLILRVAEFLDDRMDNFLIEDALGGCSWATISRGSRVLALGA